MSDTNAKSPKKATSKKINKLESFDKEVEKIQIVMGPFKAVLNDKEYVLKMEPEYAKSYTEQMAELEKTVGTYNKVVDNSGKIIRREDVKTGVKYISDKDGKITKKSNNNKEVEGK